MRWGFVTNKELLKELGDLQAQVRRLREQSLVRSGSPQGNSVQFLLAEFEHLREFWRHTDSRTENALTLYVAATGIIATGLVVLAKLVTDIRSVVVLGVPIGLILFAGGIVLLRRIVSTGILKARYIEGLNRIRCYFAEADPSLAEYLVLPTSRGTTAVDEEQDRPSAKTGSSFLQTILLWDSLLLGFVTGSLVWLFDPSLWPWVVCGVGLVSAVLCLAVLVWSARRRSLRS